MSATHNQLQALKAAQERNKTKPQPRPQRNRKQTLKEWEAHLYMHKLQRASVRPNNPWSSQDFVTSDRHWCKVPVAELKPITLRDMKVPKVHEGRYMLCRSIFEPTAFIGTTVYVEDMRGDVEQMSVYNQRRLPSDCEWLTIGTIMVVKEPYAKFASKGDSCFIRVDSPTDIIFIEKHDKKTLSQFGALK
ncbi:TPR and SET domain containing protein, partial [Aphelenchoides avenae]